MKNAQKKKHYLSPLKKLLLFIVLLILALFFVKQWFQCDTISVTGCSYYTEDEIKEKVLGEVPVNNSLYLYLQYKYWKKVNIPLVQEVEIEMVSRKELRINVYEKAIIACVKYMSEYLYFDKDGIIVESAPDKVPQVPLISGVPFNEMTLYQPLAVDDKEIFQKILDLSQLIERYELTVDRIAFNGKGEVTLHSADIKIVLGKRSRYDDQIAELSGLLPKAREKNLKGTLHMENFKEGQRKIIFNEDKES